MQIAERYFDDNGKLIIQETHDPTPYLEQVAALKSAGLTGFSEHRHVGRVPNFLLEQWLQEAGVSFTDTQAVKDVIKRKLLSGEFNNLRPWTGTY